MAGDIGRRKGVRNGPGSRNGEYVDRSASGAEQRGAGAVPQHRAAGTPRAGLL